MLPAILMAALAGLAVASSAPFLTDESYQKAPEVPVAPATPAPKPVLSLPISTVNSPNQDDRPAGSTIDTLIVHDTETPGVRKATTIANWFLNPRSAVSAHYIIGKAGEILQCVPDERRAWHAGPSNFEGREKVNDFSIGIELVNAQTGRDPFTDAQYSSLIALTTDLTTRFNIPLNRITGHRHVTHYPELKRDPADNFSWERYLTGVQALQGTHQVVRVVTPLGAVATRP